MNKLYEETAIQDIANAIREKNGSTDTYTVAQMGNAIREISGGGNKYVSAVYNNTSADGNVAVTLISGNSFIAENYNNDNAFALVVKLTPLQVNGQIFFLNTNKDYGVTASGGTTHVYGMWTNNSAEMVAAPSRTINPLNKVATAVGHMYATSDGNLIVRAGGSGSAFQTGTYFVMFGLMEE